MADLGIVLGAFFRRALLDAASQRSAQLLRLLGFVASAAALLFLARLVDAAAHPALAGRGGYGGFVLLGFVVADLQRTAVSALAARIREAQLQGTLETMLATPTPTWAVLLGVALPDLAAALLRAAVYLAVAGLLFRLPLGRLDPGATTLTLALALVAFAAVGLFAAALTLRLRRADPLGGLLAGASLIAGSVLYPPSVLPGWLAALGALLPIHPALAALRPALLDGAGISGLAAPLARLALFALLVAPAGAWLFARALARARAEGSLTTY